MKASAPVDIHGGSHVESIGSIGQTAPSLFQASGLESASYGTANPASSDVSTALSGDPNSTTAFANEHVLGLADLGGAYSSGATLSHSYTSSATFDFKTLPAGSFKLGLLSYSALGSGFNTLDFSVEEGTHILLSDTFTSLSTAETFFTDDTKSLTLTAANEALTFSLDLTTDLAGSGFYAQFLFGVPDTETVSVATPAADSAPSIASFADPARMTSRQPVNVSPVPEPGSWVLVAGSLFLLGGMKRFRRLLNNGRARGSEAGSRW